MNTINTYIEAADIENALLSISQLARGMVNGIFAKTTDGVLDTLLPTSRRERGEAATIAEQGINARDWILNNYEAAAGAIGLIAVTTDIISRTLTDHNIAYNGQGDK